MRTNVASSVEYAVSDDSPIFYNFKKAADEMRRAASSLHQLTDTIERNPESIFKGKPNE